MDNLNIEVIKRQKDGEGNKHSLVEREAAEGEQSKQGVAHSIMANTAWRPKGIKAKKVH